jgi:hypothetical protein
MSKTEKQQTVTFYHFIETSPQETPNGVKAVPSNLIVRIRGGEVHRDSRGAKHVEEYRDVKFLKGRLEVSADDVEVIETIRKLMEHDRTITTDEDVFLAAVATPASKTKLAARVDELKTENRDLVEKNRKLNERLAGLQELAKAEDALAEAVGAKPAGAGA